MSHPNNPIKVKPDIITFLHVIPEFRVERDGLEYCNEIILCDGSKVPNSAFYSTTDTSANPLNYTQCTISFDPDYDYVTLYDIVDEKMGLLLRQELK